MSEEIMNLFLLPCETFYAVFIFHQVIFKLPKDQKEEENGVFSCPLDGAFLNPHSLRQAKFNIFCSQQSLTFKLEKVKWIKNKNY